MCRSQHAPSRSISLLIFRHGFHSRQNQSWFLRGIAKLASRGKAKLSDRGAGFQILYLDDEIRMHKTFDGQYFVQKRRAGGGVSAAASSESEAATLKAYGKRSEDAGNGFVWGKTY